jgi:hypothetical protein
MCVCAWEYVHEVCWLSCVAMMSSEGAGVEGLPADRFPQSSRRAVSELYLIAHSNHAILSDVAKPRVARWYTSNLL